MKNNYFDSKQVSHKDKELELLNHKSNFHKNKTLQEQRLPFPFGGGNPPNRPGSSPNTPDFSDLPNGFGRPNMPSMPPMPGMGMPSSVAPPTGPPPSMTPDLPRGISMPSPEMARSGQSYQSPTRGGNFERNFRQCLNQFTFVWLWTGRNFWFYPVWVNPWFAEGFVWRRDRWVYERINLNIIFFFRCF